MSTPNYEDLFRLYSSDYFRELMSEEPEVLTQSGGIQRSSTVLTLRFSDGYSRSENMTAVELAKFVQQYYDVVFEEVYCNGGFINDAKGTELEIVFFDREGYSSISKALDALLKSIGRLRLLFEKEKSPVGIERLQVGVDHGQVVFGNFGTKDRMVPWTLGETLNLSYRLMGLNNHFGTKILTFQRNVSEFTGCSVRILDFVRSHENAAQERVVELVPNMEGGKVEKAIAAFNSGMQQLEQREWSKALRYFQETLSFQKTDSATEKMISRCQKFLKDPPPKSWDGIFNLVEGS